MRIVVLGSGGFCVPTFQELVRSGREVLAVVTTPLRTTRKGDKAGIPPMRNAATEAGIPMFAPENVNSEEGLALLKRLNPDLIFVCDFGRILSREIVGTAKFGGINLHGSLLPKYRGAAPINRAILAGEKELGVSVIHITPEVDAGPVIAQASYFPDVSETAVEIERRLAEIGVPLILDAIDAIEAGTARPIEQNSDEASKAPKIRKEEGRIDWTKPTAEIANQYRAFQPWPQTFSEWTKKESPDATPIRLILGPFRERRVDRSCSSSDDGDFFDVEQTNEAEPGTVVYVDKQNVGVRTGNGVLWIESVQPSGKKRMTVDVFLRGYSMKIGDTLK